MDALSEVLNIVKLKGAMFFNAEFSAPWSFSSPPSRTVAPYLAPGVGRLIIYHFVTEGHGYIRLEGGEQQPFSAGDIVIFPHGDAHVMANGSAGKPMDAAGALKLILSRQMKPTQFGGGGEVTKIICGYMGCELRLSQPLLDGLPTLVKVNIRGDSAGDWLENSIRYSVVQLDPAHPGTSAILTKLSELLFVEALRRHVSELAPTQTGWLAGARDPVVGRSLAILHSRPADRWTITLLAKEVGLSRSALVERFSHYLGEPPMKYLTQWRLQLAAESLVSTPRSVVQVACEVGYESEAAFNRAFKREFGMPPARFRRENRIGAQSPERPKA
jgi:AraC-like DNA-binding protein